MKLGRPIWVHAVSVGEVMTIRYLIQALKEKYPSRKFAISTVTPTGNKIAKSIATKDDFVFYLPLDLGMIVKRVINQIDPCLLIIVETEIWPNLIFYLFKKGIPIAMVNGRVSDRSFKGYRRIRFLLKPILNKIDLFCVQSKVDSDRLIHLGVSANKIRITGNMKFDVVDYAPAFRQEEIPEIDYEDYRLRMGLAAKDKLLIAGSTHPGEEDRVLGVYKKLLNDYPFLRLILAPRHPERSRDIEKAAVTYGFNPARISQLKSQTDNETNVQTVFILDTIGQLRSFYSIADIVFVGGSLVKVGGHNILEPAYFERPILFGPYMFNFRDIAGIFLKNKAAVLVQDANQLYKAVASLLKDPGKANELGKKARAIILENRGAADRNLKWIDYIFSGT